MSNLLDQAEAEYAQIARSPRGPRVLKLSTGDFDFLTSPEMATVPIHVIEARREERRRNGAVDDDTSLCDFVAAMGIEEAATEDPVSGHSVLHVKDSTRAYYGEQEGEAFRLFRKNMIRYAEDAEWLKRETFLGGDTADEYERQSYVDRGAQPSSSDAPTEPTTHFKHLFFSKAKKAADKREEDG